MPTQIRSARLTLAAFALSAVAGSGAELSLRVQEAEAVGPTLPTLPTLPLPTVTVPGVTTVAPPVATETTTTVTTAVTTTVGSPGPGDPPPTTTTATATTIPSVPPLPTVAGARHLASGAVSIPVSSVRAPARLRLLVSFAPHVLRVQGQRVAVALRVVDTRGYVVRGARVSAWMAYGAHGASRRVGTKPSATDGLATFTSTPRLPAKRPQLVVLVIKAFDSAAPAAASTSLRLRIPVRLLR